MSSDFLDPISNSVNEWDTYVYTAVDDGVRQPTVPTGGAGEHIIDNDKAGEKTVKYGIGSIPARPGETHQYIRVWYYVGVVNEGAEISDIEIDDDELGAPNSTGGSGVGWHWAQWNNSYSRETAITANSIYVKSPVLATGESSSEIWALYLEAVTDGGGGGGGGGGSSDGSPFLLFLD